jgi:serine/threonine protein phosphatase PrpC
MKQTRTSPQPAVHTLNWSGWTNRGKTRKNNEDSFLGLQFDAREVQRLGKIGGATTASTDYAFAVSDGMGGAMAGEFASSIAVEKITMLLPRSFRQSAVGIEAGFGDVLTELFDQIHRSLAFVGGSYEECAGMETTLSLCWFTPGWMYFGHVGDSRIYHLPARAKTMKRLSHDDTHVGWLFRNGQLNEREARTHPRRKVLQKALGGGNQFVDPQLGAVAYGPGDIFLLCTDGLVEGLYDEQMREILRDRQSLRPGVNVAQQLVQSSNERDGQDDTTALVLRVG